MESKEWSERLDRFAKICFIGCLILIIVYALVPFAWDPLVKNNILGVRDIFGCDPNLDPCCKEGYNKTAIPDCSSEPGKQSIYCALKSVCTEPRSLLPLLAMPLFILGLVALILSWVLRPKGRETEKKTETKK